MKIQLRNSRSVVMAIFGVCALCTHVKSIGSATLPPDFAEQIWNQSFISPTSMTVAPDGRLFISEQGGSIRIVKDGNVLPTPFVKLKALYKGGGWEAGLMSSVIFDPGYPAQPYVYVAYNRQETDNIWKLVVSRLTVDMASPDKAKDGSEVVLAELHQSNTRSHVGGSFAIGKDNKLYVGIGNLGTANMSQDPNLLHGKILRMNLDGSVPTDNPQPSAPGAMKYVYATGARSPFSMVGDLVTGEIIFGDVGDNTYNQFSFEELNKVSKGVNYGNPIVQGPSNDPKYQTPWHSYAHNETWLQKDNPVQPGASAIIVAEYYRGPAQALPSEYSGRFFFLDYSAGRIFALAPGEGGNRKEFISGLKFPVAAKFGPDGRLWVVCRGREQGEGPTTLHAFRWSKAVHVVSPLASRRKVNVLVNKAGYPLELLGRKFARPTL